MSLVNTASQLQHWWHHFTEVLDVVSPISELVLESVWQHEVDCSLANVPHEYEVQLASLQVKGRKAAGSLGILSIML